MVMAEKILIPRPFSIFAKPKTEKGCLFMEYYLS
jgi:hypothetical protein